MYPRYPGLPLSTDRPEHMPLDDPFIMQFIRDTDIESFSDAESGTNDHAEALLWPDILELLTWAGNTVKMSLISAFPFLE